MRKSKLYFSGSPEEVVQWWNPESDIVEAVYRRGLEETLERLSRRPGIKKVLDAACGKGRITKGLASQNYSVTAIDISGQMIAQVRSLGLSDVHAEKGEVEHIPFSDNAFDAIVCLEALVHFDNLKDVFSEFNRVLKPGGILIVDFDNSYGLTRLFKNFCDHFFKKFDGSYKAERERRMQIFRTLTQGEVISLLKQSGFKIREKFFIGLLIPFRLKNKVIISQNSFSYIKPLNNVLERTPLINRLATYIYLVCQK
jgi:ubiquinone/menaquinone biosynthesis C-methylase UbiE